MTKLINENSSNWDEYLSIVLFSYRIVYKVATWYTPYQFMYRLHPLVPTKYILPVASRDQRNNTLMRILTNKVLELEKLQKAKMEATKTNGI